MNIERLKKKVFSRRGIEYKLKEMINGQEGIFIHERLISSEPHEFKAKLTDVINTSIQCPICDKTRKGIVDIEDILIKKGIKFKMTVIKGTRIIYLVHKGKKIGIAYLDLSFYRNVIEENVKARNLRKIMEHNFDSVIILTHLEYKTLKKNLLRGLKEVW
jgi:hypothetical protein